VEARLIAREAVDIWSMWNFASPLFHNMSGQGATLQMEAGSRPFARARVKEVIMGAKMKLLIGYDGSACADCALDDLQRAGLPREAQAVVLSVAEQWLPFPLSGDVVGAEPVNSRATVARPALAPCPAEALEEALALAGKARARLKSYFTAWEVSGETASGSPAREILKKADAYKPDLIVLGCQGRSALGRFFLGSVSQKVVSEACCSVRVARGTAWKNGAPVRILIGLDGSAGSRAAVSVAAARAWPMGSEVRLITVVDPSRPSQADLISAYEVGTSEGYSQHREWVRQFEEAAAKQLRWADLLVSWKLEAGDPKHVIVSDAEEWGADCIFLGSSGLSNGMRSQTLGSVSTAVVARAQCSVEIVRQT
jgi:nucleotide-binding universal stress UspA family protein